MILYDFIVDDKSKLSQAMQKINKNKQGIIYIATNMFLQGVITDGDIRRFILENKSVDENVMVIANKKPLFLYQEQEKNAHTIMEQNQIRSLPILNEQGEIVKIYFGDEIVEKEKQKLDIPVVIMAGGKGTRLYPYTQILPKPLIPIGEETITEHIMDHFEEYGCTEFSMIVNYKKNFIKSYFEDSEKKRNVKFIEEKTFLGTGGGLKLLNKQINSTFFMTNCDILIEEDYAKILKCHREKKNLVTMVCAVKKMVIPYGTVITDEDDRVIEMKEKPELSFVTNTGFYILEPEFLELIPDNTFVHITDIIQKCIDLKKNIGIYRISEDKWLDMGQLEELEKMKEKLNVQ